MKSRLRGVTTGAWVLCLFTLACSAEDWTFRTVSGQLLDQAGRPVEGVRVLLLGNDQTAVRKPEQAESIEGWNFETDADGRFTVRLGRFSTEQQLEKTNAWLPGWGIYFLVVKPSEEHAGAIGPRMMHLKPGEEATGDPSADHGQIRLIEGVNETTLRLQEGITVEGKVQDVTGNPVTNLRLDLSQDLVTRAGPDTDVFVADAQTDRHGFFEFKNVHPMHFHLGLAGGPPYWIQTRLGGQWQDGIVDEFDAGPKTPNVLIGIVVSPRKLYRYYGQVKDNRGKVVENAKVVLGISQHRRVKTDRDSNEFVETMTGSDGRYEIRVETPWVRGFSVQAPGYDDLGQWGNDHMFKPGIYNFSLRMAD